MKKAIVVALCLLMFANSTCFAEVDFNVADYTMEELGEIYSIISKKINEYVLVPTGMYIVGKDLPAGKYTILSTYDTIGWPSLNNFSHVAIFKNIDDYYNSPSDFFDNNSLALIACNTYMDGMTYDLTDGMVLVVKMHEAGIKKLNSGIFNSFW